MTRKELYQIKKSNIDNMQYKMMHHTEFNYLSLGNIMYEKKAGRGDKSSYNDVIIMADTETSKLKKNDVEFKDGKKKYIPCDNYVVAWTISIRAYGKNIVTLYGHKPTTLVATMLKIHASMSGDKTFIYFHNLSYDWVFIRQFLFEIMGHPISQLNTKSHYPIIIEFANGIILKDSYILSQRSILKWAKDLNTEHQKAVGCWDYDKIRTQWEEFTPDELLYIECDTLAGVECIDKTRETLNKHIYSMPYTATGIPREECRNRGLPYNAHARFLNQALSFEQYCKMLNVYHGGFTHANRHLTDVTIDFDMMQMLMKCYDFSSSYPFNMIARKYPSERFVAYDNCLPEEILRNSDNYAFIFKLIMIKPKLKNDELPMPALQYSKCVKTINAIQDNGRILTAGYVELYINDVDLSVIYEQYTAAWIGCVEVEVAKKDYLPRWFTDYVFELYKAKCELKPHLNEEGEEVYDPVAMSMVKGKINSLYGMLVQHSIQTTIYEDYDTGDYKEEENQNMQELYYKYLDKRTSIFNYQHGCYVTSYAMKNVFDLGACCNNWVYTDTDSCFGWDWDEQKLKAYNDKCIEDLEKNGYGGVYVYGKWYYLGVAELDKTMKAFRVQGAKRYCYIDEKDELHITVAGVPKSGAYCLHSIDEFKKGFIFDGLTTGKKMHSYIYKEKFINEDGIIIADSVDLNPCDYLLDDIEHLEWEKIFEEEIAIQVYE